MLRGQLRFHGRGRGSRYLPTPLREICCPEWLILPSTSRASVVGPLAEGAKNVPTLHRWPGASVRPAVYVVRTVSRKNPVEHDDGHLKRLASEIHRAKGRYAAQGHRGLVAARIFDDEESDRGPVTDFLRGKSERIGRIANPPGSWGSREGRSCHRRLWRRLSISIRPSQPRFSAI
jgi:hypothetical protein